MSMKVRPIALLVLLALLAEACGNDGNPSGEKAQDTVQSADAGGEDAGDRDGPAHADAGTEGTVTVNDAGSAATTRDGSVATPGETGADAQVQSTPRVELPEGSRELDGVLNLVGQEFADEMEAMLDREQPLRPDVLRRAMLLSTNRFLELYPEEYDFIIFTPETPTENAIAGRFQAINRRASAGAGFDAELALADYRSEGRLRGIMGVQYGSDYFGPYAHEVGHYWLHHLDRSLGFGEALDTHHAPHWGFTSVNGQMGGFDEASLRCTVPADAAFTDCTPEADGRVRYLADSFAPQAGGSRVFSPLELYLMGLIPAEEVPESFLMLERGALVPDSFDQTARTVQVEADGFHRRLFTDIVAFHGEVTLLPEDQREYRAAFVMVSAQPASEQALGGLAQFAGIFGDRVEHPTFLSWSDYTGGLSKMDTRLAARRQQGAVVAEAAAGLACDALAQDCPREELACYGFGTATCRLAGVGVRGDACQRQNDCQAGFTCLGISETEGNCQPYCDPEACSSICNYRTIQDTDGNVVGAICQP